MDDLVRGECMTTIENAMVWLFGGDTPNFPLSTGQVAARAAVVYVGCVLIVRFGKSRLISHATPLDVILGFILGSLLSRGITGHAAISTTLVASTVLVAIHWSITALACYSPSFESLLATPIRGQLRKQHMQTSHVSQEDLAEALRLHAIKDVSQVDSAYKERNGAINAINRSETWMFWMAFSGLCV